VPEIELRIHEQGEAGPPDGGPCLFAVRNNYYWLF